MARHMFGWSYPPGAANDPNAPWNQEDGPCAVCAKDTTDCICPECPTCGETGNKECYSDVRKGDLHHGLKLNREQVISRQEVRTIQARMRMEQEYQVLEYLKNGGEFNDEFADDPDPWS